MTVLDVAIVVRTLKLFPESTYFSSAVYPDRDNILATNEGLLVETEVSPSPEGSCGDDSSTEQNGGLVPPLHAWRKPGHRDLQGRDARLGQQTGLQTSSQCPWRQRRAPGGVAKTRESLFVS